MSLLKRLRNKAKPEPPPEAPTPAPAAPKPEPAPVDVSQISDPDQLLELAIQGATADTRLQAAERITERDQVEKLVKLAQGKDKGVYKLAKARLNAFKAETAQRQALLDKASAIGDKLDKLGAPENDPLFEAKLTNLSTEWQALNTHPLALPQALVERNERLLQNHNAQLAVLRDTERQEAERQAQARADAEAAEAERAEQARQAAESRAEEKAQASEQTETQATEESSEQQAAQAEHKARKQALRKLTETLHRGLGAARRGEVRKARGIHREVHEKQGKLGKLPEHIKAKLDTLDAAIEELSDWHDFAVTPKKHELIEIMRGLIGSPMSAPDLAEKIHKLQDEWKLISKGVQQHDEALWQAFHEASESAYAPCRAYFEAQAAERELNQRRRQELIEQVQTYLDDYHWDTPVWKDVEKTLKVARQEWKSYWPVPRKANSRLQKTFDTLMDAIHARLAEAYQAAKTEKQRLVDEAQALAESDDKSAAANGAKHLQQQWKHSGRTWVRDEQTLWKRFRKACDDIFGEIKAEEAAEREQQQARQSAKAQGWQSMLDASETVRQAELATLAGKTDAAAQAEPAFSNAEHWPNGAEHTLRARLDNAPNLTPADQAKGVEQLGELCIRAEILSDTETPEAHKAARMTYQVAQLQQGLGSQRDTSMKALVQEWISVPGVGDKDYAPLWQRFEHCLKQGL
ncbi:DUF349 domain-containing protein [Marinimicrobium alkaliphilum]|uniref:DUF349 domain-containing protein n=1 Tax=Marinimicrobium alkaliphilum TaxID=2202654 RepID=UPI000DBA1D0C|nr:DUF349 domain-containing protein [Marinimicrobium alkaliphilum]